MVPAGYGMQPAYAAMPVYGSSPAGNPQSGIPPAGVQQATPRPAPPPLTEEV